MLRKVYLHGYFADFHDGPIEIVASTVAEVITAITTQIKGFRPNIKTGRHRVLAVGYETLKDLFRPLRDDEVEIHLIPQFNGGKKGGFLQIVLGSVLVVAGILTLGTPFGVPLITMGVGYIIGGIVQLLMPQPEMDLDNDEQVRSKYLGAPGNTTRIGTRIGILYGKRRVFGHYLSFDIDAKEVGV